MKCLLLSLTCLLSVGRVMAYQPETSAAGFFDLPGNGRTAYNFNVGWRFSRGANPDGHRPTCDDSKWDVVATPHTVELVPVEASGGRNYQGPAWYRKHFEIPAELTGKRISIYFEAAMGRSEVYVNGRLVRRHYGGYLPFDVDLTMLGVKAGQKCLIAVMVDNSDDKTYPPGKFQDVLDFAYHGGIYRDVWLVATNHIYVTDPNRSTRVAGGGVFVHSDNISPKQADLHVDVEVANATTEKSRVQIENTVYDPTGKKLFTRKSPANIDARSNAQLSQKFTVTAPSLWEPDAPHLYRVETRILDAKGNPLDGVATRAGIRKMEFDVARGFILNGKPFGQLIGTNRHQDFAHVGNALPNSGQWRDAKTIRDAGCRIIRSAHYPQDQAFMDACDELGIFIIVATPGWQYFNRNQEFVDRVYDDVRQMVRRDRNHPSVIMWEPVLNETPYPPGFALRTKQIANEEYPYPGCFVAGDNHSEGVAENYDVLYGWPADEGKLAKPVFTREWGEMVDDWYAHNTPNRASRNWGEGPQLIQALDLARTYDEMYQTTGQFLGGTQWHSFDHQRGYHPDPYWGGFVDAFRQPKYAYYMFKSQVAPTVDLALSDTGPMVFVANEMGPFSGSDVVVFSNCDSVRLTAYERDTLVLPVVRGKYGMPYAPTVFKDVYDFYDLRNLSYTQKKPQQVSFLVEGIIDGKVVCSEKKMPSRRSTNLRLSMAHAGQSLVADGSDFAVAVAEVTDDDGNVRRLAKDRILFSVEGEGEIIGDMILGANPREVEFGSAPVLIRSTLVPGKIRVRARVLFEGDHTPTEAMLELESIAPVRSLLYTDRPQVKNVGALYETGRGDDSPQNAERKRQQLMEVERQQTQFGVPTE
ncbi:MAG: glycoside hydrolase family 2 [Rikenellaceae bacterium]|nr:glycoside hydrolase family 2 [Rikenellaceae bacterium]